MIITVEKNQNKKIKSIFIKTAILFFSVILFFIIAEIGCRLFYNESQNYDQRNWQAILSRLEKNKGKGGDPYSDKFFTSGENGLRYGYADKKILTETYAKFDLNKIIKNKEPGKYRIAILGDSYSCYGGLSSEDDSFTRQLAKTLNANSFLRENKIKEFEILPFCDGGLNSYQESILLKEAVLEYQPDMLVLQFTDNDSGPARSDFLDTGFLYIASATDVVFAAQRPLPALPLLGKKINIFLFNHSAFARFISYKFYLVRTSSLAAAVRGGKTGEQVSLDAIREMSQITKNKRIPFLLFVFTPPSDKVNHCFDLTDQKRPNQWHIKVRSLSRNLGIDYMNMCDYTKDINSLKSPLEPDCYGCHYSAQGHKIITDVLTEKILSLVKAAE